MTRRAKIVLALSATSVSAGAAIVFYNPLWRSEASIEAGLRKHVPSGTLIDSVRVFITHKRWRLDHEWAGSPPSGGARNDYPGVNGEKVLFVYMGGYQGLPWHADVESFWGFDAAGRLTDIHVRKTYDGL